MVEAISDLPIVALFSRTYDGVGFFGHLASDGISPWAKFKAMLAATANEAAYTAAVGGDTTLMSSGASAYFREPALGAEWDQRGPNVPTAAEVSFEPTGETSRATKSCSTSRHMQTAPTACRSRK